MNVLLLCLPVSFSPTQSVLRSLAKFNPMWYRGMSSKDTGFQQVSWKQAARMERLLFRRNGWSGNSAFIGKFMKQSVQIMKKNNLWPRTVPSWVSFIVHEIILFPFLMLLIPAFIWICTFALALNIGSKILSPNHHYFLNCVLPFKSRFLLDQVMLFYATQRPWGFFLSAYRTSGCWR